MARPLWQGPLGSASALTAGAQHLTEQPACTWPQLAAGHLRHAPVQRAVQWRAARGAATMNMFSASGKDCYLESRNSTTRNHTGGRENRPSRHQKKLLAGLSYFRHKNTSSRKQTLYERNVSVITCLTGLRLLSCRFDQASESFLCPSFRRLWPLCTSVKHVLLMPVEISLALPTLAFEACDTSESPPLLRLLHCGQLFPRMEQRPLTLEVQTLARSRIARLFPLKPLSTSALPCERN